VDDENTLAEISKIDHIPTRESIEIERHLLASYEGGCHTAFGSLAVERDGIWEVHLGMENEEGAWQVARLRDTHENCMLKTPEDIQNWSSLKVSGNLNLCSPVRWT
jgi:porphobilinogen deaminase